VVEGATATYAALAARLKGRLYFHGDTPSAIDALLFAHLNYHYRAPVVRRIPLSGTCFEPRAR
jgi:glutathione S-transferase